MCLGITNFNWAQDSSDLLDIYELTNRGDGISNEVWHIDDFHISPDGILEAWKNFNIEN